MDRPTLLSLVEKLGAAFKRRGMRDHVAPLRLYYLALRHGLTRGVRHEMQASWSEELVLEWMKLLRLPPFETAYALRPEGSVCDRCPARAGHSVEVVIETSFPGGRKKKCLRCRAAWLEPDGTERKPLVSDRP